MAALAVELIIGLGGMLLTALFTPKPRDQWGSRLSNINVPPVSPGNVIPRVWGTMKVPAQMIFCSPLIETMHTHQASKKGGGKGGIFGHSAKTYTFTYSVDVALGVCGGPIYQVNRIWANQKLLWVNPVVAGNTQSDFDAAYQAEATYLIDEEGVTVDYAAASAFVFAWNNYMTAEVTLGTPADAVTYIMSHPIDETTADDSSAIFNKMLYPDQGGVTAVIDELYSSLNNQNTYLSQINRFDNMEIYLGTDGQGPNGLLEGYLGQGYVPSFRNCCYFVITNLQLMDFGNTIPTFNVEVQRTPNGTTSLPEILTDVCYQAGLQEGQFDCLSNVDPTPFGGFAIVSNTSAREVVADLQKVFPLDAAESGFKIIFNMLNQRARQVFDRNDLGAHADTEPLPPSQEITVMSDYDLPQRINLKYQEPARNYSVNSLYAARYNTPCLMVEDMDVTVALDRSVAQTAVNNLLANRMMARHSYKMMLPRKYITVEPTDAFRMPSKADPNYLDEYYCTEVHIGANGLLEVHAVDHYYVDPNLKPTDQVEEDLDAAVGGNQNTAQTSQTVAFMLDTPLLSDTDTDGPGFYVMLCGAFNAWQGGSLYVDAAAPSVASAFGLDMITPTSGSAWEMVASSTFNVPQGICLNALAPKMHACYWDRESELTVLISNGMHLLSASEDDMLIQPLNATIIGGEVVQYASAVQVGSSSLWKLSNFLRGLRGTEHLINGHQNGEYFVRMASSINRVVTTMADIGVQDSYEALSTLQSTSTAAVPFPFTDTGNAMRPYTVKVYRKFRNVDGDVEVDWWPRVRQNGQWLSGSDVTIPANDSPEAYEVDVLSEANQTSVVKTYSGVSGKPGTTFMASLDGNLGASFVYTAAMQAADLGAAQAKVYLAIYQISQKIGRGFGHGVIA